MFDDRTKKLGDFQRNKGKSILPDNGEEQLSGLGGKLVRRPRPYKLKTVDFKAVMGGSGAPYVIVDCMVINECAEVGQHCELGFSLSPAAESIAYAWLTALGLDDEARLPVMDPENIQAFLQNRCKGKVFEAAIIKGKDKTGTYDQNSVSPPWEILASEAVEGDVVSVVDATEECPI